jgi:hypothetical protein
LLISKIELFLCSVEVAATGGHQRMEIMEIRRCFEITVVGGDLKENESRFLMERRERAKARPSGGQTERRFIQTPTRRRSALLVFQTWMPMRIVAVCIGFWSCGGKSRIIE